MSTEDRKRQWNMLDSYQEGQTIYGRDAEISSISESIQYNIQTFLYGKSGIGKTSLLQAGIFPVLRKNFFFPVVVRLGFYENEPLADVVKRLILEEAEQENPGIGKKPLHYASTDGSDLSSAPLWQFFSKMKFTDEDGTPYIPVLVLDQFEETINNEINWQKTVDFLRNDLYDLLDNSLVPQGADLPYTNYRIVFSMREDYLYCLEDIVDQFSLWELRYNRFRIKALNQENAEKVIYETFGADGLEKGNEKRIVDAIIKLVKTNSSARFTEINTALLSLICSLLEDNAISNKSPEEGQFVRFEDLRLVNPLLTSYYDGICDSIGPTATKYLENHLLTKDGRRSSIDRLEALNSKKITESQLSYLEERHLIRRIKTDNVSIRYEYIHDLFAKMIAKRKGEERTRWLKPEYSTISKREDVKNFALRCFVWILIFFAYAAFGYLMQSQRQEMMPSQRQDNCFLTHWNGMMYFIVFGLSAILLPSTVKRLHDTGHSGWIIAGIPIAIFLCSLRALLPMEIYDNGLWEFVTGLAILVAGGYVCIFLILLIKPSSPKPHRAGVSRMYETVYNSSNITHKEFIIWFSAELLFWLITCLVTDLYYMLVTKELGFTVLRAGPINDLFHININEYPFILFFPIVVCFSPTLKSRIATMGYSRNLGYIPVLNILILLIALLPDSLLTRLHLFKGQKQKNQGDNIFAKLNDSFSTASISNLKAYSSTPKETLLLLFVPFYAFFQLYGKKKQLNSRVVAYPLVFINYIESFAVVPFLEIVVEDIKPVIVASILQFVFLSFFVLETALFLFWLGTGVNKEKGIMLEFLKENPHLSREDIANMLINGWPWKRTFYLLDKLLEQGKIRRTDKDGEITWEVVQQNDK